MTTFNFKQTSLSKKCISLIENMILSIAKYGIIGWILMFFVVQTIVV